LGEDSEDEASEGPHYPNLHNEEYIEFSWDDERGDNFTPYDDTENWFDHF
jgi:hypothetical protein